MALIFYKKIKFCLTLSVVCSLFACGGAEKEAASSELPKSSIAVSISSAIPEASSSAISNSSAAMSMVASSLMLSSVTGSVASASSKSVSSLSQSSMSASKNSTSSSKSSISTSASSVSLSTSSMSSSKSSISSSKSSASASKSSISSSKNSSSASSSFASSSAASSQITTTEVCPSFAIFCEDFEVGSKLDSVKWDQWEDFQSDGGHFAFDNTVAAAGQKSMALSFGGIYGMAGALVFQNRQPMSAPNDDIYLRMYIRFQNTIFPGGHPYYVSVVGAQDQYNIFGQQMGFGTIWTDMSTNAFTTNIDFGLPWRDARNTIKANEWYCLQIHAFGDHSGPQDMDHTKEEWRVWIDGKEIPDLLANDAVWTGWGWTGNDLAEHWSPAYNNGYWRFGFASIPDEEASDRYWIDAIAFAHQPVPCLAR